MKSQLVDVFPISTIAFGLKTGWMEDFIAKIQRPSLFLVVLMLIVSIGIMALKRFEDSNLENKIWNIPVVIITIAAWPFLILGLKHLVDSFNTFLVHNIFQIPWEGFGFPSLGSMYDLIGWSAESLARLLPNLAYWIIYAFYLLFFFSFAILGPLVLAKGVLTDEIETLLELVGEIVILFLWQTMVIIVVAFIMPEIVSGQPFPAQPQTNFYFLSLILGIILLFVPTMTRKFGQQLSYSFSPPGLAGAASFFTMSAIGRSGLGGAMVAARIGTVAKVAHKTEEVVARYKDRREIDRLRKEKADREEEIQTERAREELAAAPLARGDVYSELESHRNFVDLSKQAKKEFERGAQT